MSTTVKLAAPIIESKLAAQTNQTGIMVPFLMNKAVGWSEFKEMSLWIKTVQTSTTVAIWKCSKNSIIFKDGKYWAPFEQDPEDAGSSYFNIGQSYKIQIAYIENDGTIGHYSSVGTFKFSAQPDLYITKLKAEEINVNTYNYTGVYENIKDSSEKVYSYEFVLSNNSGEVIATSGEQLHNSSKDTSSTMSTDEWTLEYSLENEQNYLVVYKVKTVNGLECSSIAYRVYNGPTFNSNIMQYCDLMSEVNKDEAYVELSLQSKSTNKLKKYINGKFILLRSSSEDNYQTWYELTKFTLTSHNVLDTFFICRDHCVSQGITYQYAIQAYNDRGVYSNRQIAKQKKIFVDFEDMFLTDKDRQLKIRFNPKITSFKNTLLEVKMDTMGGKYPFFFRNGNVSYKEFPISGLISLLMDEAHTFVEGIQAPQGVRATTPANDENITHLPTDLSADNIRREREFKMEVLKWLTNGEPKLFRSPTEGSYIVRLMNTSLSPNDTLGRMLHTFSSTAYEVDDFTLANLRKYGIMIDEQEVAGGLEFKTIRLDTDDNYNGVVYDLSACSATIQARPFTKLRYRLKNDGAEWSSLEIGPQGMYSFPSEILLDNPLMAIAPPAEHMTKGKSYWNAESIINYATQRPQEIANFGLIDQVILKDRIRQFIGDGSAVIDKLVDSGNISTSLGLIHYLKVSARPIIPVDKVETISQEGQYSFKIGDIYYTPTKEELLKYNDPKDGKTYYYDGNTRRRLGELEDIDFTFGLYKNANRISMKGTSANTTDISETLGLQENDNISILQGTSGRLILRNLSNVDYLHLGDGVYMDIAYQEISTIYTIEVTEGSIIKDLKQAWIDNPDNLVAYKNYYDALTAYISAAKEDSIIDAI